MLIVVLFYHPGIIFQALSTVYAHMCACHDEGGMGKTGEKSKYENGTWNVEIG